MQGHALGHNLCLCFDLGLGLGQGPGHSYGLGLSTNAGCSILPASKDALSADIHTFCRKTNVVVTIQSDITRFCIIALICFKI